MGARELLTYLEKLEIGLSSFSYEELGTVEAGELKKSFESFKHELEDSVFGVPAAKQLEVIYEQMGIQGSLKTDTDDLKKDMDALRSLISILEKTELNVEQQDLVKSLKSVSKRIDTSFDEYLEESLDSEKQHSLNKELVVKNLESIMASDKVNLKPVLQECMGQMELLEELIRLYKQNILEFIGSVKVRLQAKNFRGVDFACQKIQPCLKMMRTVSLLEITEQMATVCQTDNDLKYLNFLYNQFLVEYPKVEELVDFEIEVLRNM